MSVGDKVKLRNIPANNLKWLQVYKNLIGKIIDCQARSDQNMPKYVRVSFGNEFAYVDLAFWRVEPVGYSLESR
tara:strand:+ start:1923 stop:2144 length:222 start_codon:yes stop_codon:yes gene_type:complete